jgi:hypothetical protein
LIKPDLLMEALKIAVTCVIAAVLYGIVPDQFTARICIEYFTIFHPPIFHTQSPTLLGIGWGIVATWWVGVFFAVPMILAARAGSRPALRASELLPSIASLLGFMAENVGQSVSTTPFRASTYLVIPNSTAQTYDTAHPHAHRNLFSNWF